MDLKHVVSQSHKYIMYITKCNKSTKSTGSHSYRLLEVVDSVSTIMKAPVVGVCNA